MKKPKLIISVVLLVIFVWYFAGGGLESHAAAEMNKIENQVALDAEKQYEIAKKGGNAIDAYTQASFVAATYLQANDQENYNKWKAIEKQEAAAAGMPVE